jgi:hypothetical protein
MTVIAGPRGPGFWISHHCRSHNPPKPPRSPTTQAKMAALGRRTTALRIPESAPAKLNSTVMVQSVEPRDASTECLPPSRTCADNGNAHPRNYLGGVLALEFWEHCSYKYGAREPSLSARAAPRMPPC